MNSNTAKLMLPWLADAASTILKHHGLEHQKAKTVEECSEAVTAFLQKNKHGNVEEEFADAFLMTLQMFVDDSPFGEKMRKIVTVKAGGHLAFIRLENGTTDEKV